ncbi:MAG: MBL fold metallo-hydrolase [Bacteroidota bacterium]
MKKIGCFALFIFCLHTATAQYGSADSAKTVRPFKIFDNLYYIGNDFVSAYLLVTDKGLILIDALYGKYVKEIPIACRQLGFDVKNIKYILCTHGHYDHCEGADEIKKLSHARVGMTAPDWQMAEGSVKADYTSVTTKLKRDWVIHDGDSLVLGNGIVHFYETPGHTPGTLSLAFMVSDGKNKYNAFMFGGIGLNFDGVPRTEMYLKSVDRIMQLKNMQVNISNHPGPGKIFEREALLTKRKAGESHPFVAPAEFQAWMAGLKKAALTKLKEEKAKTVR